MVSRRERENLCPVLRGVAAVHALAGEPDDHAGTVDSLIDAGLVGPPEVGAGAGDRDDLTSFVAVLLLEPAAHESPTSPR